MYTKYKGQLSGDTDYRVTHSETVQVILMTDQSVPRLLGVRLHDVAVVCVDEDHNVLQFTHENVEHSKVVCVHEDHSVMQFTHENVKHSKVVCVDEDHNVLQFTHKNVKHNTVAVSYTHLTLPTKVNV